MGKIALLVSREEMLYQAHNILQERQYGISEMRVIETEKSVIEARSSIANGASIIIARGLQASLIKQYTDIPVVEVVITAQEMALLIMKAKQIIGKDKPVIAVVGFRNMFCDMSYFDDIYEIELRTYYTDPRKGLDAAAGQAVAEGADLVIGGDTAVAAATRMGVPSLFLSITEDSLRTAFAVAENMDYAMEIEKRNAAQMETLLDYSFNGVVKIDKYGKITVINQIMEEIMGDSQENYVGKNLTAVFGDLDSGRVREVLENGREAYSTFLQVQNAAVFGILAPVVIEGDVDGAILSCHKIKRYHREKEPHKEEKRQQGLVALGNFRDVRQESLSMQECVHLCRVYSGTDKPVLLLGEPGTETKLLAHSIHNNSLVKDGAFVQVDVCGLDNGRQEEMIFGSKGAVYLAQQGTLYLQSAEALCLRCQSLLYQLLCSHALPGSGFRQVPLHIRVILSAGGKGSFREDLRYLLESRCIQIPPIRERKEDLQKSIEENISYCCETYSHFHVLTHGAMEALLAYSWPGNLTQLEGFCERLILMAGKRSIDEIMVNQLLSRLYVPALPEPDRAGPGENWDSCEEAALIQAALIKNGGSREKTAVDLGFSKATLWRKMKKYQLQ